MSNLLVTPELVAAAAADLAGIGSAIGAANAAAGAPTMALLAAGADEVSAAVAAVFSSYAQQYQALSAAAAAFHDQFVRALAAGAGAYAGAEAANVEQQLLNAINAPTLALLGRPLIGNGADGAVGTGQAGGAGGLLYGNGGNGGSGAAGQAGGAAAVELARALVRAVAESHGVAAVLFAATPPRRRPSTGVIRREPAERTRLSDTRNTVDHIIFQGERSPSLTHKRTKRQPAIAAGLNAPRRNRVGRQHGWPADVPSAEQRRAQRQRDLEAIRRAYAEMVATSHEIDDDTAELALLSMHLDDEQRRLEAGMKLGWHPYHFPDEPDSKQ